MFRILYLALPCCGTKDVLLDSCSLQESVVGSSILTVAQNKNFKFDGSMTYINTQTVSLSCVSCCLKIFGVLSLILMFSTHYIDATCDITYMFIAEIQALCIKDLKNHAF